MGPKSCTGDAPIHPHMNFGNGKGEKAGRDRRRRRAKKGAEKEGEGISPPQSFLKVGAYDSAAVYTVSDL